MQCMTPLPLQLSPERRQQLLRHERLHRRWRQTRDRWCTACRQADEAAARGSSGTAEMDDASLLQVWGELCDLAETARRDLAATPI